MSAVRIAIIGAGPAGLMAADTLSAHGVAVDVYDAMPTAARKFLMAGKGGMNITHAEPLADFLTRYGARRAQLEPLLQAFPPDALRDWIHALGIETFVGTSGRVFPKEMKAAPLLRAWLHRLRERGVRFHMRHRWLGWGEAGTLEFAVCNTPHPQSLSQGGREVKPFSHREKGWDEGTPVNIPAPSALILALGGASWPQLGSDGAWTALLAQRGIAIAPLRPSNCGFEIAWSAHFRERHAGEPLKSVVATFGDLRKQGECMIDAHGIEGGLIYALSAALRDEIETQGHATLHLDLMPDWPLARITKEISHPRGSRSLASHLASRLGLKGAKASLLREVLTPQQMQDDALLAQTIKALPLQLLAPRPIAEAISSAGGVRFEEVDGNLMLRKLPGVFVAGEMLDWEAPTGGYLLSACFASGHAAAKGILARLPRG